MCVKCVVNGVFGVCLRCVCECAGDEREARTRLKQSGDINVELRVPNGLRMAGNVPNGV